MNFNALTLARNTLRSDIVRNLVGERVIDLTESFSSDNDGNIITRIFNFGGKLVGFVVGALFNFVTWSLSELWDIVVEAYFEIKFFDWNQTDQNIKQELESNNTLIAGALGTLAGTSLVWLTGIGVSVGLSFKFPVVAGRVALALAEEGGQEIRATLTNLIMVSRNVAVQNFILSSMLTARKYRLFNQEPVLTEKKPWTIANEIEEKIESITNAKLKAFANNFVDAVEDSVIEMGYVVAFTLDDHFASQQRASQDALGQTRTVNLTPDTQVENEQLIIQAPQELIIPTIQNAMANHQMIHNRDVGQIVGMPETDYLTPRPQRRKLKIIFRSVASPPWKDATTGKRAKTVEINVPDVKAGLTWTELTTTIKAFTWGSTRVTAELSNGRQITVYGATDVEAKTQITKLLALTNLTILRTTQGTEDNPLIWKKKLPTQVYPAYAKLMLGDIGLDGNLLSVKKETIRIDLWPTTEPPDLPALL
jgi:hypothetical protein